MSLSWPRNTVQFHKGVSEAGFGEMYGSKPLRQTALVRWRWPEGADATAEIG